MISASVVTFNHSFEDVKALMDSLSASRVDVIFVIDHSDRPTDLEDGIRGRERFVFLRHFNNGYGGGHNVAIARVREMGCLYHLVVNPDVLFDKEVIGTLADYMDEHDDVGQIMPKVLFPNGTVQRLAKLLPSPADFVGRLCLPHLTRKRNRRFELVQSGYDRTMDVPYLSGCFMFLRMSAVVQAGMFDERFFMYGEDIDLTRRIHRSWKTLFFPQVHIFHSFARGSRHSVKLLMIHVTNIILYFNKYGWFFDRERRYVNDTVLKAINSES